MCSRAQRFIPAGDSRSLSTIDQYVLPEQIELIANLAYVF